MSGDERQPLIATDEAPTVKVINPDGGSSFLLIGDHAGNAVPRALGSLGIAPADLARHIGWDIGIATLGAYLARTLDAVFVSQTYSRLVIDCNRAPGAGDAIPAISDGTRIPGNDGLNDAQREERVAAIHEPYQAAIAAELARRDATGQPTILIALHSFTPAMRTAGETRAPNRPWHIGILHDGGDAGFAMAMLDELACEADLIVGDNEPYRMDLIDYTIPRHAYPEGRLYAELEIRQDLLGTAEGCAHWAKRLARVLPAAAGRLQS